MSDHSNDEITRWNEVRDLFHQARALPKEQRGAFLDQECAENQELRGEVERLLDADERALDFLDSPLTRFPYEGLSQGQQVGPFQIIERIGAGNMGEIYLAERQDVFTMKVALKVIDATKVDEETVWRFHHERQILARLRHPNIARIIDGGSLDDGRPWFALEYVEGTRIDTYCNEKNLSVRERIELFRKVCAAVTEAHSSAIVHRDLKPANILVTQEGEPRLLDFGIAEIADGDAAGSDDPTRLIGAPPNLGDSPGSDSGSDGSSDNGSNALTPLYASPEQAKRVLYPDAEQLPTVGLRSDIYALGVVLFELLTGHPPYGRPRPWPSLLKAVVDEEIPRCSEVVATRLELDKGREVTPESVAAERGTSPAGLRRALKGDLDAIVAKATQKDPQSRYASVVSLDADLQAHLEGYPVSPRRADGIYRAGRFLRRHLAAAVILISLAAFAISYQVAKNQTREAIQENLRLGLKISNLEAVNKTIPSHTRRILDETLEKYGDSPWLAEDLTRVGHSLEERGSLRNAELMFRYALDIRKESLSPIDTNLASAHNNLAGVLMRLGGFEEAEQSYRAALAIRELDLGPDSFDYSRSLNNLAALYQDWDEQHLPQAEPLLQDALRIRRNHLEETRRQFDAGLVDEAALIRAQQSLLSSRNNLGTQRLMEKRFDEAEAIFVEVLAGIESLPDSPAKDGPRARILRNLALVRLGQGRLEQAERDAQEALRIYRRDYLSWRIADAESVLGAILAEGDRLSEGRLLLESSTTALQTAQGSRSRHAREAEQRCRLYLGDRCEEIP